MTYCYNRRPKHMLLLLIILSFWGPDLLTSGQDLPLFTTPRQTFPLTRNEGNIFQEKGVRNYTTMLLREDIGVLFLGAQETIFALDIANITHKKDMVKWEVTEDMRTSCSDKGKNLQTDCWNYIRILHKWTDGTMYVCGTNAFSPACKNMTITDGKLTLKNETQDGRGKCPFDPFQGYASELIDDELYSATAMNFLGTDMAMSQQSRNIRTEAASWLIDPTFIDMKHVTKGMENPEGDDDEVYLFFFENAVEYDSYVKFDVSRVARVCKGDVGGLRVLHKRWTSFLKAQLDCPVLLTKEPLLIKAVFLFCPGNWTTCVFYGVFTPQTDMFQYSAVCAFRIHDIRNVFSEAKFKTLFSVPEFTKWVKYTGEVPDPRPGACINNDVRQKGYSKSSDLPDKTLQFIKDNPLMDQVVKPSSGQPLLVKKGAAFTSIVVTNTTSLNGTSHQVMFIGTASGSVLKAVNYDGKMFIIEEVQLFNPNEPVKILRLSTAMGQLYAGSDVAMAQMPFSSCSKYASCIDCVLARDPYCGWNLASNRCIAISNIHSEEHSEVVQSLKDTTRCPAVESRKIIKNFYPGQMVSLPCQLGSNLARMQWCVNDQPIESVEKYYIQNNSLLILDASYTDIGNYICTSVESSNGKDYVVQSTRYELKMENIREKQNSLLALVIILSLVLLALVIWNFYKGHFVIPTCFKKAQDGLKSLFRCNDSRFCPPFTSPGLAMTQVLNNTRAKFSFTPHKFWVPRQPDPQPTGQGP